MGALRRLNEAGLKVPDDVSLVGFDNLFIAGYVNPPLTTVSHLTRQMGRQAVQMFLEAIAKRSEIPTTRSIMLQPEFVVRKSSGQARS